MWHRSVVLKASCVVLFLCAAAGVGAQALQVVSLPNGTEVVHVSVPLSEATSVGWPAVTADGGIVTVAAGGFTLLADLEVALAEPGDLAPPVVVAVGGAAADEIVATLARLLTAPVAEPVRVARPMVADGRTERRLTSAGSDAGLRLVVALPPAASWRRSSIEVLWSLLPELVGGELPGALARLEEDRAVLEAQVDADLAELKLGRLRLALAQIGGEPDLDRDRVEVVRRRLAVRRAAGLDRHPESARLLVRLWLEGGLQAIREHLFGLDGVTPTEVALAAREWLPQHPGTAVLLLPPRVFSPRFAAAPRAVQLEGDLAAGILERPGSGLAAVSLLPVLTPDLDGSVSATILARVAAELRSSPHAPGWIRVAAPPAMLELAAPIDDLDGMVEQLHGALRRIAGDDTAVPLSGGDARRRALHLTAGHLGLAELELSPAGLLSPRNLALGVVAADGESAEDALRKLLVGWSNRGSETGVRWLGGGHRTREVAPGDESVLVLVLPLPPTWTWEAAGVVKELLGERCDTLLPEVHSELLRPLVPGRRVLLLVLRDSGELALLEEQLVEVWSDLVAAPPDDESLAPVRRRVAAAYAARSGGALGRAAWVATVAAGQAVWSPPSEVELQILSVTVDEVAATLAAWRELATVATFGAGVMPIVEPGG
jgi:hypothetical protein